MTQSCLTAPRPWCRAGALLLTAALLSGLTGQAAHAADTDDRLPPLVAEFRQALLLERNLSRDNVEGLAFRKQNLQKKVDQLRTLVDLSRTLLLLEWGTDSINPKVVDIDSEIRIQVAKRFQERFKRIVKDGTPAQKAAAAYLVADSAGNLRKQGTSNNSFAMNTPVNNDREAALARIDKRKKERFLKNLFSDLSPEVVKLTSEPEIAVRKAAAYALGQIQPDPAVSIPALAKLLDSSEVSLRRVAATALTNSILVVTEEQRKSLGSDVDPIEDPSDKAIEDRNVRAAIQETRGRLRDEPIKTSIKVVPVACKIINDPDTDVRKASTDALQQITQALSDIVPTQSAEARNQYPDRVLSERDDRRLVEDLRRQRASNMLYRPELQPIFREFQKNSDVILKATFDKNVDIRIGARRSLENLGNCNQRLDRLEQSIPEKILPPPGKKGNPDDINLKDLDTQSRLNARQEETTVVVAFQERKPAPDALTEFLRTSVPDLVRGLSDKNRQARLGAIMALEAAGLQAASVIPDMANKGLSDPDPFVRWATARALGELAPRQAAIVVPKLADALCESDLDVRITIATAIRHFGIDAAAAVPALAKNLNKGDVESRVAIIQTLTAIGPAIAPALPNMARELKHPDPRVRAAAAEGLGAFGSTITKYLPHIVKELEGMLNDDNLDVRTAAGEAILRIDEK